MAQQLRTLGCSSRGPWFDFKHPRGSSKVSVTPVPGYLMPCFGFHGYNMHMMQRHIRRQYIHTHTHTHKGNFKNKYMWVAFNINSWWKSQAYWYAPVTITLWEAKALSTEAVNLWTMSSKCWVPICKDPFWNFIIQHSPSKSLLLLISVMYQTIVREPRRTWKVGFKNVIFTCHQDVHFWDSSQVLPLRPTQKDKPRGEAPLCKTTDMFPLWQTVFHTILYII